MPKTDLKALSRAELEAFVKTQGQPAFRSRQLFSWMHGKGASSFEAMSNLPKAFRAKLEDVAYLSSLRCVTMQTATDQTAKALLELDSGRRVETVLIPDFKPDGTARRLTVCVSSQVGCAMGCTFCATATMGLQQNLTAGDIIDQARFADDLAQRRFGRGITNVVFMGMGEPLMNYEAVLQAIDVMTSADGFGLSPKRITVSTVGLAKRIRQLADDDTAFKLAISLHAPTDEQRSAIMPVNRSRRTDLSALEDAVKHYYAVLKRPVTYEYCTLEGVNDSAEDAKHLARITRWAPSKVNLIVYNPVDGTGFTSTSEEALNRFIRRLVAEGVTVTVRRSRGQDIDAACGQLAVSA
ncbi:MAG: 23S rRNA (adenine(2503)-C(2))-methyltransferase RlmN [Bacteroidota bacterium]